MSKKLVLGDLAAKIGYLRPILKSRIHQRLIFMNCAMGMVGFGILLILLKLRKLDFRSLKCPFGNKKANFRGLTAKIDYLRPIFTSRTHLWTIFMDYAMETVAFVILKGF